MLARVWKTAVDPQSVVEYERFARDESLPMFESQPGFRGALLLRDGDQCVVVTLWEDQAAIDALRDSATYQAAVEKIEATGFLRGTPTLEIFQVHGAAKRSA